MATFITGLQSPSIQQKSLENNTLNLKTMFDQAWTLETAVWSSESYVVPSSSVNAAVPLTTAHTSEQEPDPNTLSAIGTKGSTCCLCGNDNHPRSKCPARDALCSKCHKRGHFASAFRRRTVSKNKVCSLSPTLATVSSSTPASLSKSSRTTEIEGFQFEALLDSSYSESFIHPNLVDKVALTIYPSFGTVSMATSASIVVKVKGTCSPNLSYQGRNYDGFKLLVLPGLCADFTAGLDFQSRRSSVVFHHGGTKPPLSVCGFSELSVEPPEPFGNLTADCHPIAT